MQRSTTALLEHLLQDAQVGTALSIVTQDTSTWRLRKLLPVSRDLAKHDGALARKITRIMRGETPLVARVKEALHRLHSIAATRESESSIECRLILEKKRPSSEDHKLKPRSVESLHGWHQMLDLARLEHAELVLRSDRNDRSSMRMMLRGSAHGCVAPFTERPTTRAPRIDALSFPPGCTFRADLSVRFSGRQLTSGKFRMSFSALSNAADVGRGASPGIRIRLPILSPVIKIHRIGIDLKRRAIIPKDFDFAVEVFPHQGRSLRLPARTREYVTAMINDRSIMDALFQTFIGEAPLPRRPAS